MISSTLKNNEQNEKETKSNYYIAYAKLKENYFMAKANKKMVSEYMNSILPSSEFTVSYPYGDGQSLDVQVKRLMTVDEKTTFVDRVTNGCFDSFDDYRPEMRDVVFQITVLQMLTNVPVYSSKIDVTDEAGVHTGEKTEIVDLDKTYNLCKCLDLRTKIADPVFVALYDELVHLVAEKIVFKQQRTLLGEKKMLERVRDEMETGIAMINSIGDQLNGTLQESFKYGDTIHTANEFSKRMENMSDKQLIDSILNK